MTIKYPEKFKEFVEQTIERLQELLFLQVYDIKIKYQPHKDGDIEADIEMNIQYLKATINIYSCVLEYWPKNKQAIEEVLLHEMCHIIIDTIRKNGDEETHVCWLVKILRESE